MSKNKGPKEHVYVVVRIDKFQEPSVPVENTVSVTKVYRSLEKAEAEVARLDQLNGPKGAVYFWRTGRLQADAEEEGSGSGE